MTHWPEPSLRHLARMTDEVGIVEHAEFASPRRKLGYCIDDAGRLLALASRLASDPDAERLASTALGLLVRAHAGGASFRLRLGADRRFTADPPSDDGVGRALLGLGTAAAWAPWLPVRVGALELFGEAAGFRSPHPRATSYAVLGGVELLRAVPRHAGAERLVDDASDLCRRLAVDAEWPWPEPRLTYANALLPHARLAAASVTGRSDEAGAALAMLGWLVGEERHEGRCSFTPVAGRGRGGPRPAFDQQPIEAWAMADACACAYALTSGEQWADATARAASWFLGRNDLGVAMYDPVTGGGYDGLESRGVNSNQGAESSLAFVATMALVRAVEAQASCEPAPYAERTASR